MTIMRKCKYCGEEFRAFGHRDDKTYCDSPTCRSKYHQECGRGYRGNVIAHLIHQDLPWEHPYTCVECGTGFLVNDYAERTGKRVPKYCSKACKQKAYRKRKKQAEEEEPED